MLIYIIFEIEHELPNGHSAPASIDSDNDG